MLAGVDLGGTQVRVAAAGADGKIVSERQARTWDFADADRFISWIAAAITEVADGKAEAIGLGSPGPLDPKAGRILNAANLPAFCRDLAISERLAAAAGAPVHLENDANLAAVGEHRQGAGTGARNMIYVTWSTGIGSGIIIDGRLYSGSHGTAGEIGHTVLDPAGPLDGCGQRGCVEAYAGGRMLERRTGRPADELFAAAKAGERAALRAVTEAAGMLGVGLLNLTNLFDPDLIVIGGGVTSSWALVRGELERPLRESPFVGRARRPAIRRARLGARVGLVGAVEWARTNA
jgi:glucokinase